MSGTNSFTHTQSTPSLVWTIAHNLNKVVVSDVFVDVDGKLTKVLPSNFEIVNNNVAKVTFSVPMSGIAKVI